MSRFQRTKDEYFMIALYEMAMEAGDFETPFDRYAVGERGGVTPKAVNAIAKLLIQANFIKKSSENRCLSHSTWTQTCRNAVNYLRGMEWHALSA